MTITVLEMERGEPIRHGDAAPGHRLTAGLAALVLSLVTGVPLRSAQTLLPDSEDRAAPYLGL